MYLQRPNAARSFVSSDGMLKVPIKDVETMRMNTPAVGAALPQFAATVQQYKSADALQVDVICSGTWVKSGDTIGFLMQDTEDAIAADYCIKADKILVPMAAGASSSVGNLCWIDTTTMTCYATGGANRFPIGIFRESTDRNNPTGMPTGDWALISFDGRTNTWIS